MPRLPAALPQSLGAVFTWAEAQQAGVSSRRLMHGDVQRIAYGVYRRVDPHPLQFEAAHPARREQIAHRALALAIGPHLPAGAFFCGETAAALWDLPVSLVPQSAPEVAVFAPRRALADKKLRGRTVQSHLVRVRNLDGVAVADPASTWAMLAPRLAFREAVALGDAVLHRPRIAGTAKLERQPHASLEDLRTMVAAGARAGAARLRSVLPHLVVESASAPESHLRLLLQSWGLPPLTLDHDVRDRHGRLIGCSEIALPSIRLAVEYEGRHHLIEARQWNRDIEKYRRYAQEGWEVIRVTSELLYQRPHELRAQVQEAVARRS